MNPGLWTVEFKPGQYVKKAKWQSVTLAGLMPFCAKIKPKLFDAGVEAIWLKPSVTDAGGKSYPWLILDIESHTSHSDIRMNLESAREFLRIICEHGLEVGLIIFLSGKGLRFCWPYLIPAELHKAFSAWITSSDYLMIDPSPHTKKAFYRMFANRNNTNQGAVLNRHIHRLNNINDLWFMDESDYLGLVNGSIEIEPCLPWLSEIIPTGFVPDPWVAFLNGFKTRAALADTIYKPIMPIQKHRKPIAYLAEQAGLEFRALELSTGEILQLRACPICGRKDGRPWISQSGRLKCHHANSCEAGQSDEQGRVIGLPASDWLPGNIADDFEQDETPADDYERISLQAARDAVQEAFRGKSDTYITLSPGAGKTHSVLLEILADESGKIAIATPEHKLNSELFELAVSRSKHPERVHMLQGRNAENCNQYEKIQEVSNAGYPAGVLVCSRCTFKRDKSCTYMAQFEAMKEPSGLWLMTHAMSIELEFKRFDLLVIDESPLKVFLQKQASESGSLERIRARISPAGRVVLDKIMSIIPQQLSALEASGASKYDLSRIYVESPPPETPWAGQPGLWELAGISADEVKALDASLAALYQWENEKYPQYLKRLYYDEKIDFTALKWLQGAIAGEPGYYVRFKKDRNHPAKFISFQKRLPNFKGRIIALDATGGSLAETENLFQRQFDHFQGKVEMPGLRTAHIKQSTGKTIMNRKSDKQIGDMLKAAAEFLKPTDKQVLIVTHMAVEESVKRLASELLPDREISTCHFWGGSRGVNQFGECSAVISLGQPFPNIGGLFDHSMALISEPSERVAWIAAQGTSELVQALHRCRPVKGGRTVIHIGKEFPVAEFGYPNFKTSRSKGKSNEPAIQELMERLSPAVSAFRIMTKAIGWMFGVALNTDIDKMKQAHEMIKNNIENGNSEYLEKYESYRKEVQKRIVTGKDSETADYIYYSILIDKIPSAAILSRHFLILNSHITWDTVLKILAERYQLPEHQSLDAGHRLTGIGFLDDVQNFYESLGAKFNKEQWKGTYK